MSAAWELACPRCRAPLSGELACAACGGSYRRMGAVPLLLPPDLPDDMRLSIQAWNQEWAALEGDEGTQREVAVLAGLLRVATGLDRNHAARVQSVSVKDKGDRLVVKVVPVPGEDISLELYAATARTGLLDSTLGVVTEIREG